MASLTWPEKNHAAVAVYDERKGEKIVIFTEYKEAVRKDLQQVARENQFSELVIPRQINIIDKIPVLGSGKTDYISLTKLAESDTKEKEESGSWMDKLSKLVKHEPTEKN